MLPGRTDGPARRISRSTAHALFVSEARVKTHLLHLYEKRGVNDRAAAVDEAYRRGLLS